MRDEILCAQCPMCGSVAAFSTLGLTPWFCPMDDCEVLGWDPYVTAYQNLINAGYVEVIDLPRPPAAGA
jgi:hypothetical protein